VAQVVLQGVSKTYPGNPPVHAVVDVDLVVADGEFVVLVGPSGCGKSTLLRMVAGLEEISAGTVSIGDRVVNDVTPQHRDIAMVFQDYALYPHLTARKNMSLGLMLRGLPGAEVRRRVQETADMLGLTEQLDRKPAELSGGQRQRVAVGRAIVREPACFLFDEPLSNLDARLRLGLRAELKALHARLGVTSLYVTHDQEEALTLGSRIVVLDQGRVQQIGTPLHVYRRPDNRFVAGFVGAPPMNFVDGVASSGRFGGGGLDLELPLDLSHAEGPVVLGLRPEAIGLGTEETGVEIVSVEPLGDRSDVVLRTRSGARLVARVPSDEGLFAGGHRALIIDARDLHLFAPGESGASLR
jgi:ABC-type sugar transport system ATPase subunit